MKDGKAEGLCTQWYDNGKKKCEGHNKDGKPDGRWSEWTEEGERRDEWLH